MECSPVEAVCDQEVLMVQLQRVAAPTQQQQSDPGTDFLDIITKIQTKVASPPGEDPSKQAHRLMQAADTLTLGAYGDNKLTASELAAALGISEEQARKFIDRYNTPGDKDGALDETELTKLLGQPDKPEEVGGGDGGGKAGGGEKTSGSGQGSAAGGGNFDIFTLLLMLLDADGDGKISPKEAKKLDKNGDGKISKQELVDGVKTLTAEKGHKLSDAQVESLTAKANAALNGQQDGISVDDFASLINSSSPPKEA
jgi:Ca2+-binding EF-hand superfamily protein